MRVLTITFHRSKNYGASLQAYALQKALEKCGYETAIIDYSRNIKSKTKGIKGLAKKTLIKVLRILRGKKVKRYNARFSSFINDKVVLTEKYDTYEQLMARPPKSDMYLVGSDQVWNITYRYRPEFFADFAPKNIRVASYAASIARYDYNDEKMRDFAEGIKKFSPISVREKSAAKFLLDSFGIESLVHLDPVFLLTKEDWEKVAVPPKVKEKYILCYALTRSVAMEKAIRELKKKTGYKVISICPNNVAFVKGDVNVYDAGPQEFLGYFANAEYVLTTSFHGTAFSIIFEKNFYNFTNDFYSSRTTNLLGEMMLTDRIWQRNINNPEKREIDYSQVRLIKNSKVAEAYDYLKGLKGNK